MNTMSNTNTTTSGGVGFAGLLITVLSITLKLCNVIAWSWWWVLSPICITAGLILIIEGLVMVSSRIDRL